MKKLTLLSIIVLFSMCKTPSTIFSHKDVTIEEKIEDIKEENRLPEESDVKNLPEFAQIRDDFRSVSDGTKNKYLKGMKATDKNSSVIILTKGFKGENISIKNENKSFFYGMTISDLKSGIAKSIRVDNTTDITIHDTYTNGEITIESDHAKMFKFIYIMKNNSNKEAPFKVTFSNTLRPVR